MFADEARFGRMNRPRPCWAPLGTRPEVDAQLIHVGGDFTDGLGGVGVKRNAVLPRDRSAIFNRLDRSDLIVGMQPVSLLQSPHHQ